MSKAIQLLRQLLDQSAPGEIVKLTSKQAALLATLGPQELGELADQMSTEGEIAALKKYGLKGRRIAILPPTT